MYVYIRQKKNRLSSHIARISTDVECYQRRNNLQESNLQQKQNLIVKTRFCP